MPQNNQGEPRCINHEDQLLDKASGRDEWYHALTMVIMGDDNRLKFNPKKGMPLTAWICPQCGYVELYAMFKESF
jgi:hypothetical protein